jgi:Domain of unknown function (DUF4386)
VLFAPLVVLLAGELADADGTLVALSLGVGVLASVVQFLGLIRWPFLAPYLAREEEAATPNSARSEAINIVFQAFNRYLGVAVGEHLGYAFTGLWSIFTGVALIQADAVPPWLGLPGVVIGPLFLLSAAEFLGRFEPSGWTLAGRLTPIAYILCRWRPWESRSWSNARGRFGTYPDIRALRGTWGDGESGFSGICSAYARPRGHSVHDAENEAMLSLAVAVVQEPALPSAEVLPCPCGIGSRPSTWELAPSPA